MQTVYKLDVELFIVGGIIMNRTISFVKRLILFFVGMTIIQFGVALFLKTNIGSDPFTVFTQGLATLIGKSTGIANMIILAVLITGIFFIDKKRINIGTLICVIGVGPIIDLGVYVMSYLPVESYNIFIKIALLLLGCFVIAVGFAVLSAANVGVAPNDIVPFIIQDKTKIQYRYIRITLDSIFLIVGFLMGGTIGIGTVIGMLSIGPFIQFCLPYGKKFVDFIVGSNKEENKAIVA